MNTKIKLVVFLLVTMFFFTFSSCEKDLFEKKIIQNHKKIEVKTLTGEKASLIANKLFRFLGKNNISINQDLLRTTTAVIQSSYGTIKYDEIRQVIDSMGKTNYSFRVEHPQSDYKTFFNLVFQEKGGYSAAKLVKFQMTDEFAQLYKRNLKLDNYKGTISSEILASDMPCPEQNFTVIVGNSPTNQGGGSNLPPTNNPNQPAPPFNYHAPPLIIVITIGGPNSGGGGGSDAPTVTVVPADTTEPEGTVVNPEDLPPGCLNKIVQNSSISPGQDTPCITESIYGVLNPIDKCSREFMANLPYDQKVWLYQQQTQGTELWSNIINYTIANENGSCHEQENQILKDAINAIVYDSYYI